MKASDSTTSLTALTEVREKECFICLEDDNNGHAPLVDSKILRRCGCRFFVHPDCWNEWMKDKSDYDCPICRKESIKLNIRPNPVLEFEAHSTEHVRISKKTICILCFCIVLGAVLLASIILWG